MNTITNERPADLPATQDNIVAQKNAVAQGKSSATLEGLQHVMHISMATYVASLTSSIMSYKHATLLEAATGLAIMCERNAADRHARRMLVSVYAAAGYSCSESIDNEYKSVMRKVSIISELFNFIGAEKVQEWVGGNSEGAAIAAIVKGLEPFGIRSMDGILSLVGKPRMQRAVAAPTVPVQIETKQPQPTAETPPEAAQAAGTKESLEEGEIKLPETVSKGEKDTEEPEEALPKYARRSTDVASKQAAANAHAFILGEGDYVEIGTEHVSIRLSHDADKSEILKAALQLMEIADEMEAKQMQEKADSDSALAIKLMEEMRKMTTGKKAPSATEGGLEPMKPAKGRRLAR